MTKEDKGRFAFGVEVMPPAPSIANGAYANMALVSHTETEFVLDFIYVRPECRERADVSARVITSPKHMKRLLLAVQDNISKFETKFGTIEEEWK